MYVATNELCKGEMQMEQDIGKLQLEKERLERMAERDWLTGIFNRGATEERINRLIEQQAMGVLLVLDVDHFKQINDHYGHIAGDQFLQKIAQTIGLMVRADDILGRVGGDEFVVFMPVSRGIDFAEQRSEQIKQRLKTIPLNTTSAAKLSVTIGCSVYQKGDTYQTLFDRADQGMIEKKRARNARIVKQSFIPLSDTHRDLHIDVRHIQLELSEQEQIDGAYCQDYEAFKCIYRFTERRMRRSEACACVILFTLTDGNGNFPLLAERELLIPMLAGHIQHSLRAGDVFTQYSSGQFLVMVADVNLELANNIAVRIRDAFYNTLPEGHDNSLLHHCFPLTAAGSSSLR